MSHDLQLEKFKTWIGTKRFVQWSTVKVSTLLALEEAKLYNLSMLILNKLYNLYKPKLHANTEIACRLTHSVYCPSACLAK